MLVAHVDTNTIDHIYRHEAGVTPEHVEQLKDAIGAGRLRIPASVVTAEELLSAVRTSKDDAFALGPLYLELASMRHCVKQTGDLVGDAIHAYAQRSGEPTPYVPFTARERRLWELLAAGKAKTADVDEVTKGARAQVEDFKLRMDTHWTEVQAIMEARAKVGKAKPSMEDVWPGLANYYADGFAERAGAAKACRKRGISGLLKRRRVLAAAGGAAALVYAQAVNGRHPDLGDSRDLQHIVTAAAVGSVFVTHDGRLAKLVRAIPGLNLEAITIPELAMRVKRG
jgi:hypothetical protein